MYPTVLESQHRVWAKVSFNPSSSTFSPAENRCGTSVCDGKRLGSSSRLITIGYSVSSHKVYMCFDWCSHDLTECALGWSTGFVTDVYPYDSYNPSIAECLTFWVASSMGIAGSASVPTVGAESAHLSESNETHCTIDDVTS